MLQTILEASGGIPAMTGLTNEQDAIGYDTQNLWEGLVAYEGLSLVRTEFSAGQIPGWVTRWVDNFFWI